MSKKENRESVIGSISNWIKLMALIVLVAEVIILLAMTQTPTESSLYVIYPIMMFLLLLVVIGAVIYDRTQVRRGKVAAISANHQQLNIDTANMETEVLTDAKSMYTNSLLGYEFELPSGNGWHEPKQLNYYQYFAEIMMMEDIDEQVFNKNVMTGSFLGPSFVHSDILTVMHGETVVVELDAQTSTEEVENRLKIIQQQSELQGEALTEEGLQELREMANQSATFSQIRFNSKFEVWTFPRGNGDSLVQDYNLTSFFQHFLIQGQEPIETLVANEDYILWTTNNKMKKVIIKGNRHDSLSISRWYRLHRGKKFIYLITMQWSPEFDPTLSTWERLKSSFESFKIKK